MKKADRRIFAVVLPLVYSLWSTVSLAQSWKEEKGDHFIVYHVNDAAKPRDILHKAEQYYTRVAHDLGYARYSSFWQWDDRVKIYVHPSKETFQKMTGQPAWSDGMASYMDKSIHTIEGTEHFLTTVLPHEITHLIFRDFVGLRNYVPLWLDEGVAQWMEQEKRDAALQAIPALVRRADVFSVRKLTAIDIRTEQDARKVGIFYVQAISLVDFLIGKYGSSRFTDFCRELRDKKTMDDAIRAAYAPSMQNMDDLQDKWIDSVLQGSKQEAL